VYVRQQLFKEFEIALPVEDNHRNPVAVFRGPGKTREVLSDDVLEQGCLARAGHPENDTLHDPNFVWPDPGFLVHVIAEQDRVPLPGSFDFPLILIGPDYERRTLLAGFSGCEPPDEGRNYGSRDHEKVECCFQQLGAADVKSGNHQVQAGTQDNEDKEHERQLRVRLGNVSAIAIGWLHKDT